jgi:exopolysaccharide production protein ExoZ
MDDPSRGKVEVVQAMRGIAALLVVMWHGSRYFAPYGSGWAWPAFAPGANLGVDLFFLISGFIMVMTTRSCDGTSAYATRFMVKRLARVWPPYIVSSLIFLALHQQLILYLSSNHSWDLLRDLSFVPAADGSAAPPVFAFPVNPVGWTLNYEMYFYTFFAASLAFGPRRWLAFAGWLLLTLVVLPLAFGSRPATSPAVDYGFRGYLGVITNPIILLFAAGCVIAGIYQSSFVIRNRPALKLAMLFVVAAVVLQYWLHYRVEHGIFRWGLTLVPLLLIFSLASKSIRINVPRPMTYLGDISYSLYLFHPFAQEGLDSIAVRLGLDQPSGFPPFFLTTGAAIAIAALSHRYLEGWLSSVVRKALLRATRLGRQVPTTARLAA